jgi:hypothetical protein
MSEAAELAAVKEELAGLKEALGKAAGQTSSFGQASSQALKQIGNGVTGFATAMANGQQGASAFNGVINSAGGALGTMLKELGPLGTAFSKLTDFAGEYLIRANQQSDALFKSFQDLSRVGGAGAEGMTGVFDNMQKFGLSMNQLPEFGAMIAQNSEALAVMGGTVSQGTKAFAGVASSIQQSGLQSEFERMGLTTKNINEGTANYLRIQTLTSAGAVKTQAELNAGAAEYIRQQDKLSRLTGKSADALAKQEEAQQANERYAAVTLELQMKADAARAAGDEASAQAAEDQIKQNKELLARTPEALKQGVMDLMSGFVNSPEAKKMYISLPEMSQSIISQNFKASQLIDKGAKEADANTKRNLGLAKAGLNDATQASFAGQRALSRLKGEEAEKEATTQATTLAKGGDVDVNNQVAMRQAQTATTLAMDNLVNKGVGPVTAGMLKLATGIEKVITTIPKQYIGEKTSTKARPGETGSGRGEETPAAAGYGTNFKPEDFKKFVEDAVANGYKAITSSTTSVAPPVRTSRQAHEVLSGASNRVTGTNPTRMDMMQGFLSSEQANNILQRAAGPNTNYRTNLGDTTLATERTAPAARESSATGSADLTQGLMTLAQSIGSQTTSMSELVELMRRSNGIQERILQQARN